MRRFFLPFLAMVVVVSLVALVGCRTMSEFIDGSTSVNKTTILLAVVVSAGVAGIVTGFVGILAGVGSGTAMTWLSTTQSSDPGAIQAPSLPWYLDPWSFIRPILTWLAIAIAVGLFFERSRQQTVQFIKDVASLHPVRGARRFAASVGWKHSDPVPSDDKQQAQARLTKD